MLEGQLPDRFVGRVGVADAGIAHRKDGFFGLGQGEMSFAAVHLCQFLERAKTDDFCQGVLRRHAGQSWNEDAQSTVGAHQVGRGREADQALEILQQRRQEVGVDDVGQVVHVYIQRMDINEELDDLREKLRETQDRVFALELELHALAEVLHETKAIPIGLFEMKLHQSIREIHGKYPDEFPETVRWMIVLRDYCEELRRREPNSRVE